MTRVLVDVDGVLGDFVGAWLELVFECTGRRYEREQIADCNLAAALGLHSSELARIEIAMRRLGFCSRIQPIIGAVSGLAELRNQAEVRIVTRPLPNSPTWCSERLQWLENHFQIPPSEVFLCEEKHGVQGDWLIDDDPKNLVNFPGKSLLWDRPHNRGADFERVSTWEQVICRIKG